MNTHMNNVKIAIRDRESYDENLANHFKHHLRYTNLGKFAHLCDIYKYIKLQGRLFSFLFSLKIRHQRCRAQKQMKAAPSLDISACFVLLEFVQLVV